MAKKITREDVAKAAGVSTFTVSMALRDQARVAVETREHVKAVAARLGYVPNAVAAMFAKQRHGRATESRLNVAYLAQENHLFKAVKEAGAACGMAVTWRRLGEFASPAAATRQLWQEGYGGLLVQPHRWAWTPEQTRAFGWHRFAVVKLTSSLAELPVHMMRYLPFDYMDLALREVAARGYRRVAVLMEESASAEDNDARWGALLNFHRRKRPSGMTIRWRQLTPMEGLTPGKETMDWLAEKTVDAVVVPHWTTIDGLVDAGCKLDGRIGYAALFSGKTKSGVMVSGGDARLEERMARACRVLLELVQRGEKGLVKHPAEHVLVPEWIEGETLPFVAKAGVKSPGRTMAKRNSHCR